MQKVWLCVVLLWVGFFASGTLWSMNEFSKVVQASCSGCRKNYTGDKDLVHVCTSCYNCFCAECLDGVRQDDGLCPNEECEEELSVVTREYSKREEVEELYAKKKRERFRDSMQRFMSAQREGGERKKKEKRGIFGKLIGVFSTDE